MKFKFSFFYIAAMALVVNCNARAISVEDTPYYTLPSSYVETQAKSLPPLELLLSRVSKREAANTPKERAHSAADNADVLLALPYLSDTPTPVTDRRVDPETGLLRLTKLPDTKEPATAAGVLPLSIDPKTGEVMALLGIENRHRDGHLKQSNELQGIHKDNQWVYTDFGGKVETQKGETKKVGGAREGREETAFFFREYMQPDNIIELSTRKLFTSKKTGKTYRYASYTVSIPYVDADKIEERAVIERNKVPNDVEKKAYAWVKLSELLDRVYGRKKSLDIERTTTIDPYGKGKKIIKPYLWPTFIETVKKADENGYLTNIAQQTR